jgi:shikimate 5-dehydrogenase
MLVNQGAIAFRIWTGRDADSVVMREALEEFLAV